ncbi:sensor histidine kinase [Clostridium sp. MCC353]|uniref:sensor histidine kinase n=1 Tax=Clostridium sp. MCC353 TaxID=2592646 RepID=UPI001C0160D2|nr:HAMP domain-containing sensor histidine kinase [Clostridium sp. MCC353]MBT9778786.1 sensor histidine kinase [Clostridium sp. MCC353]
MIKKLRRQLTALYTVTTGLILTAVVIGVLLVSAKDAQKKNLDNFQNNILNITSRIQSGTGIDWTWLSKTESRNGLIIHIEDNGFPLLYNGSWQPLTGRAVLIDRAWEYARSEGISTERAPVSSSFLRSSVFTVSGDFNDTYYASVLVFPSQKGFQSLTLLSYQDPAASSLYKQRFFLLFLEIAGIAGLFAVSWFFVGRSLKPIEESRKKQNEFIAAASHELRSPLSVIRSSLSAVTAAPDRQEQFLKNIDNECCRMSHLINDMLLLASADTGTWSFHPESLDMDTLLIDIYECFEPLCQEKGLKLDLLLPETPLPHVRGDKQRLQQVFTILLDNAMTYSPVQGTIRIQAELNHKKNSLIIGVEDEGCGIPDELKKHVFERFYRADDSRNNKQHYGLGLSIAKELMLLHNGSIAVTDGAAGGSRFILRLPIK